MSIRQAICQIQDLRVLEGSESDAPELLSYLFFAALIATTFLF